MRKTTALLLVLVGSTLAADQLPSRNAASIRDLNESLIAIADKLTPTVVTVFTEGYQPIAADPSGQAGFGLRHGSGSGVIVTENGYIVTNAHVVVGATRVYVQMS
jgi:S1-C subfamily serine protease